jgi:hypothetical protein
MGSFDPFPRLTERSVDEAQLLDEAEITPRLVRHRPQPAPHRSNDKRV